MQLSTEAEPVLLDLMNELRHSNYHFVTPTPATHKRVLARRGEARARNLRDAFGWSMAFAPDLLPANLLSALDRSGLVSNEAGLLRSKVRVSSLGQFLFAHSAFPTDAEDAVFFGPDSYRFADFVRSELPRAGRVRRLVDIGAGAGVGGITAQPLLPEARISLIDINPGALRFAAVNARHAGIEVELVEGDGVAGLPGIVDLAIANPPYLMDDRGRYYRDGGDDLGSALSLDWAIAWASRLAPGGRMLLYTGSAIVDGRDGFRVRLESELGRLGCTLGYRELDPDVFGEELEAPAYANVERIAAVGAVIEAAR